jgi:hypothetical protein
VSSVLEKTSVPSRRIAGLTEAGQRKQQKDKISQVTETWTRSRRPPGFVTRHMEDVCAGVSVGYHRRAVTWDWQVLHLESLESRVASFLFLAVSLPLVKLVLGVFVGLECFFFFLIIHLFTCAYIVWVISA